MIDSNNYEQIWNKYISNNLIYESLTFKPDDEYGIIEGQYNKYIPDDPEDKKYIDIIYTKIKQYYNKLGNPNSIDANNLGLFKMYCNYYRDIFC